MRLKLYASLQDELGYSRHVIDRFCRTAPNKYKVYTIPKRTSGHRVIAHPSKALKKYQNAALKVISPRITSHTSSFAYRKNVGIKDNAQKHSSNRYLLKMDFNDFFNSIEPDMFFSALRQKGVLISNAEKRTLTKLFFWNKANYSLEKLVLSVGAPSSPVVSNLVMYDFDEQLTYYCKSHSISYSRYADDITFSTNKKGKLFQIPQVVKNLLGDIFQHRISINERKTVFSSKAHNRHITGVTINNEGCLSIGRDRKRMISAMVHKFSLNQLELSDFTYLQGLLSFSSHIEPTFYKKLEIKYGHSIINKLRKGEFNDS